MTKKEEQPKKNRDERENSNKDLPYNPDITGENKKVLNNQSKDEGPEGRQDGYFEDRQEPVDYAGADLDVPEQEDRKVYPSRSMPQDVEKERRPKKSANSNDNIESQSETVYKGEKAEKYKDPSKKDGKGK